MTIVTNIAAPGFVDLQHLYPQRVIDAGYTVINSAVTLSAQLHTDELNALMAAFVTDMDPAKPQRLIRMPVITELQPLAGQDDNPTPVRGFDKFQQAWPLQKGGFAWGDNRESRVTMTVQEANGFTVVGLQADTRWNRRHLLAALFTSSAYTFEDEEHGVLTIKPLANGDTDSYIQWDGESHTDNHYLAQAAAIDDTHNPFPTLRKELKEHPLNQGDVVVYIAENLEDSVSALKGFVAIEDPDITPGSATSTVTGRRPTTFGGEIIGKVDRCWIVVWEPMPDDYLFAHTTAGGPFIGRRQHIAPELRGLFPEFRSIDGGTHQVNQLLRYAGYAPVNRTAAVVMKVGSASYTPPAAYRAPLPM